MRDSSQLMLSICITTMNREKFIGATIDSILDQLTDECELLVLDGASIDKTPEVLSKYAARSRRLRYIRQETNNGLDKDYDRAVELAHGEYCWLMTDDDLLNPGAVDAVLKGVRQRPSLIIVNVQSRNFDMSGSERLHRRWLTFDANRVYKPEETDRLVAEVGPVLRYIGCIVIRREVWRERDTARNYGSLFNYLGVIFQTPLPEETLVISEPLISYRWGNSHGWAPALFESLVVRFPSIIWSLPLSDSAKNSLCRAEPWRSLHELWYLRSIGHYSWAEYKRWIQPKVLSIAEALMPSIVAFIPRVLANTLFILYYQLTQRRWRGVWEPEVVLQFMRDSPFYLQKWRPFSWLPWISRRDHDRPHSED